MAGMLAALMIPPIVVLVPAYITVCRRADPSAGTCSTRPGRSGLVAANGFNIFLLKRFFVPRPPDEIPGGRRDRRHYGASSSHHPADLPADPRHVVSIFTVVPRVFGDFVWLTGPSRQRR